MPDWAIVLLAAFTGGLAGAVLQPLVTLWAQQINSGREVTRRRNRNLRRMLETLLYNGQELSGYLLLRMAGIDTDLRHREQEVLWQAERIIDTSLREMAREYYEANLHLYLKSRPPTPDWTEVERLRARLEELRLPIMKRMDELNWPEVDD